MGDVNDHHSIRPWCTYPMGEEDEEMADEKEKENQKKMQEEKGKVKDEERQEDEEEGRIIRGKKHIRQPNQEEYDDHMRTHIPFRKWCPHCVKGKREKMIHTRHQRKRKTKRCQRCHGIIWSSEERMEEWSTRRMGGIRPSLA